MVILPAYFAKGETRRKHIEIKKVSSDNNKIIILCENCKIDNSDIIIFGYRDHYIEQTIKIKIRWVGRHWTMY